MLQGYAVHLNDQESTFDITVYGKIEKLHYSLLALQYTAVSVIFITLLLRICSRRFGKEIDDKADRVSTSEGIAYFIQAIKKDVTLENYTKSSWEYTIPYLILLGIFIGWDSVQYKNAEKISKSEWFFFFPIPCIAPIIIGVSFGVSILLFIWYCTPLGNFIINKWDNTQVSFCETEYCICRLHDIVNFPILTGLSVFFVFHGMWMLLIFSAYPNLVIIKSLFLLPLYFFIITLLPRSIKGLFNLGMNCKECNKCMFCEKCNAHKNCKECKCTTCKKNNSKPKDYCCKCTCKCTCKCNECTESIHCEKCKLCNACKKCDNCRSERCFLCKHFKLCKKCEEDKEKSNMNFTAIYGFSVTLAFAIPLLIVLYYGSDYILVVTKIIEDPLKLLITLAVLLGVPYYLILLWDNDISENKNTSSDKKTTDNSGTPQTGANSGTTP